MTQFRIRITVSSLFLIILIIYETSLYPEIKRKILKDGTTEYYNRDRNNIKKHKKHKFKSPYNNLIERISKDEGVDPYLIKCIIRVESNFNPEAVSVAGAMGLMQIMQDIARYYNIRDPLDPEENLKAGIKHFKSLLNYFNNDISLALAAYHAGIGRIKKRMKIPPIKETKEYVKNIIFLYTGEKKSDIDTSIKRLYKRINKEGTIEIYN